MAGGKQRPKPVPVTIRCAECGAEFDSEREFEEHDCADHFNLEYQLDL